MYTSYFSNLANVANPLSICGGPPDWYTGPQYKILAPKKSFFFRYKSGELDEEGYISEYYRLVLDLLDPAEVFKYLSEKYGDDVTLICYEKPGEFCHRRIVADWFETHLSVKVPECIVYKTKSKKNEKCAVYKTNDDLWEFE